MTTPGLKDELLPDDNIKALKVLRNILKAADLQMGVSVADELLQRNADIANSRENIKEYLLRGLIDFKPPETFHENARDWVANVNHYEGTGAKQWQGCAYEYIKHSLRNPGSEG